MDIAIVGAGVGGLALANGLAADGHDVRVFERAPALRTDGAAVTIFSNGMAAAAGLQAPLDGLGAAIDTLEFCTADGRPFARADLRLLRRRTGFGVATVPRAAILQRLAETLPAAGVTFGCQVDTVAVTGDRATLTAVDGTQHTADVVVGADGYRSTVRRTTLGDGDAKPNGWVSWQGLSATLPELAHGSYARCVVGPAGLCGLMPAGQGLLQWWFDVPVAAPDDQSVVDWLRNRFAAYTGPVRRLLDEVTDTDIHPYPHVLHGIPERWGNGPTTLLGDAAHAFPPSQAQGANQALEDAWLLRRALSGTGDLTESLRRYEHRRTRRVRRIAGLAATEVTNRPPSTPARLAGRLLTPGLLARLQLVTIRRCSSVLNNEHP